MGSQDLMTSFVDVILKIASASTISLFSMEKLSVINQILDYQKRVKAMPTKGSITLSGLTYKTALRSYQQVCGIIVNMNNIRECS